MRFIDRVPLIPVFAPAALLAVAIFPIEAVAAGPGAVGGEVEGAGAPPRDGEGTGSNPPSWIIAPILGATLRFTDQLNTERGGAFAGLSAGVPIPYLEGFDALAVLGAIMGPESPAQAAGLGALYHMDLGTKHLRPMVGVLVRYEDSLSDPRTWGIFFGVGKDF